MTAAYGALAYTLYSIAVAHANDHAKPEDFVKVSGGLLLLYGFGTMIGPVIGAGADEPDAAGEPVPGDGARAFRCSPPTRCCASTAARRCRSRRREAFKTLPSDRARHAGGAAARSAHQADRRLKRS